MADSSEPVDIELKPSYYWTAVAASLIPGFVTILLYAFNWGIHMGTVTIPYWVFALPFCALYYAASCFMIQTEEFGGITVLETPALELEHGFVYAPFGITELERFPRKLNQHQFPGEPEDISKLPDDEADRTRERLMRPIRITTAGEDSSDPDDPLNSRLTLEPSFTVIWQVQKDGFFEFYTNIPGKTYAEKLGNLLQFMRDTGEKALNIEISRRNAAQVTSEKEQIADEVQTRIAHATERWGIMICEVNVLGLEPDHATNIALAGITQAKANAKSTLIVADADSKAQVTRAKGTAESVVIQQRSLGEGLKARAEASGVDAETLFKIDAAVEIGKNNSKIIISGDLIDIGKKLIGGKAA